MIGMDASSNESETLRRFNWNRTAVAWADTVGPIGRTALRARAPRSKAADFPKGSGRRPGRFAMSIRYQRKTEGGTVVRVEWTANTPYARWVIEPTAPHEIRAKAARFLRFKGGGGTIVFTKKVKHPGTKGNDFAEQTMRHYEPVAQGAYTRMMRESMGGM